MHSIMIQLKRRYFLPPGGDTASAAEGVHFLKYII